MINRINLYGRPGASKSTLAAYLFTNLKDAVANSELNIKVELVREYVKNWAYLKREIKSFNQIYIFGKQLHAEDVPLSNGVDVIVSDSPLMLGCCYSKKYNTPGSNELISITKEFEKTYPSINIVINRSDRKYVESGRYETYEEAKKIDEDIYNMLIEEKVPNLYQFNYNDREDILKLVKDNLKDYNK